MERINYIPHEELTGGKQRIAITDIGSIVEARSKDVAADKSTESTEKPKGFWNKLKDFGKKIWKRSELSQTIERYNAEKKIKESGNLFVHLEEEAPKDNDAAKQERLREAKEAHDKTVAGITNRFTASKEFEKDFIHTKAGERRHELEDGPFKNKIIRLIKDYARGSMSEDRFFQEKNQLLKEVKQTAPEVVDKGKMYADNLFEVAKWAKDHVRNQVKQGLDHMVALDSLDKHFEVVVGRAREAVRTEAQLNSIDRITNFIQKYTGGALNEATVAVGVAAVYGTASKIVEGSLKKAAAVFGLGMAASGTAGALRESRKLEVERAQHARERAQGKRIKGDSNKAKRREELEKSRIGFKEAKEIELDVTAKLFSKLENRNVIELTEAEFKSAIEALADVEARIEISDNGITKKGWLHGKNKYKVDLIGYSNVTKIAEEQGRLDAMRAKAKILLKKWAEAKGKNFEQILDQNVASIRENLYQGEKGILEQNQRFAEMKKAKVIKAFAKSAVLSGAFGLAVQEARAFFDNSTEGAVEHMFQELRGHHHIPVVGEKTTLAEGAFRRGKKLASELLHMVRPTGPAHEQMLNGHKFKLDGGLDLQPDTSTPNPNDYYLVDGSGNKLSGNLQMNPDGSLTANAEKWLKDHGFNLHEIAGSKTVSGIHNLNSAETLKQFPGLSQHARVDWHDEPGKFWSEIHNQWLEFEGKQQMGYLEKIGDKVYLNTSKVMANFEEEIRERVNDPNFGQVAGYLNPDGSPFVDPKMQHLKDEIIQAINNGTLREHFQAAIIPTEGANKDGLSDLIQGADSHGRIFLGPEWSKYFTKPEHLRDGHLPFKFLELRYDGHTIGTARGFAEEALTPPITEIAAPEGDVPFVVTPPIPMYRGRRPGLEEMERVQGEIENTVYIVYGRESQELRKVFNERMSPTLRENPQAVLDFEKEFEWYVESHVENNKDYLKDLNQLLKQPGMRERMAKECRAVSCIPVYDLGEGKGIEHTLDQYRKQIENGSVKPEEFELILFLNHPKDRLLKLQQELALKGLSMDGAEQRVKNGTPEAYDTEEVIKQYRQKHPEMKIRVMSKEFETRPQWGWIIKYAYDAACVRAGMRKNPVNKDFLILTNDADLRDMSDKYMRTMIEEFDKNEDAFKNGSEVRLDGFVGRIDHDNETYEKWPNFFLASRFDQFLDAQNRYGYKGSEAPYVDPNSGYLVISKRNGEKQVVTQGRNTAIRGSAYCAVGGARVEKDAGADTELGDMVRNGRRGADSVLPKERNPFKYQNKIWLETDPRRELGMYKDGRPIAWAWNDWDKMDVYGKSFAEQISGDQESLNIDRLQREFYETMNKWGLSPDSAEIQRAATWLGLAGVETNDNGEPIDAAGNVIQDVTDESKYIKYKDYEIGDVEIKNADGSVKKVRAIKILSLDHVNKKVGAWKPKRQRVDLAAQKNEQKSATQEKESETLKRVTAELDKIVELALDDSLDADDVTDKIANLYRTSDQLGSGMGKNKLVNFMSGYLESKLPAEVVVSKLVPAVDKYNNQEKERRDKKNTLKDKMDLIYRTAMDITISDSEAVSSILQIFKDAEPFRKDLSKEEVESSMQILKTIPKEVFARRISPNIEKLKNKEIRESFDQIKSRIANKWGRNSVYYNMNNIDPAQCEKVMLRLSRTFSAADPVTLNRNLFNRVFRGKSQAGLHIKFVSAGQNISVDNGDFNLPIDASQAQITRFFKTNGAIDFAKKRRT